MRRHTWLVIVVLMGVSSLSAPAAGTSAVEGGQYPNLVPLAPHDLTIGATDDEELPALRFSASIWNQGDYAFELLGRPSEPGILADAEAEQCIAWAGPRACAERKSIGTLSYHQEHGHYHLVDFALYELRSFRRNGTVNMGPKGLVMKSDKVSFCLQDVQQSEEAAAPNIAPWPLYYGCYAGMGVQGISPAWIDIYGPSLSGQYVPLSGVPDGTYALVIHTDPGGRVFETNDDDNTSVTGIRLLGGGTAISIFCTSRPGSALCDQTVGASASR